MQPKRPEIISWLPDFAPKIITCQANMLPAEWCYMSKHVIGHRDARLTKMLSGTVQIDREGSKNLLVLRPSL